MSKIEDAARKAEDTMTAKYGNAWLIIYSDESGGDKIEIKDEYVSEYDKYYEIFFFN